MTTQKIIKASFSVMMIYTSMTSCYRDKEDLLYQTRDCSDASIQAGSKFTAVEAIINSQCTTCHYQGGTSPDLSTKCSIVDRWNSINNECVVKQTMPTSGPLSSAEQQAITDWVNAGHKYTD